MAKAKTDAEFDQQLYETLYAAVEKGNTTKVKSILQKFTNDEARDVLNRKCEHNSVPLLIVAIRNRHTNLVQHLVDHYDVRVDQTDLKPPETIDNATIEEWTPILEGIVIMSPVILDILCKKAKHIDIGFPVHYTCKRMTHDGVRNTLQILLRHGAQINIRDKRGNTPLIVACRYRNYYMVNLLLQNGADVNICSLDGNTALHHLIEQNDDCKEPIFKKKKSPDNQKLLLQLKVKPETDCNQRKSAEQAILKISKDLLEHGMLQIPNERGLTPLDITCLKGSESIVEFLLDKLPVNDREKAKCYELLASSLLLKNGLTLTSRSKHKLDKPYDFLTKAMILRHSHNPPLSKCRKQDSLETVLYQLETQTLEELATIKTNVNGLITDLLFARQRILKVEAYNDYLLPFMGEYINYKMKEQLLDVANVSCDNHVIGLLLNAFRFQRQSLVHPSSDALKERIKWLDNVCRHVERLGTVNTSVFGAILDSIKEFYKCRNSENAPMTKDTYVLLLNFLHCVVSNGFVRNDKCIGIKALTKRFLCLTKSSVEPILKPMPWSRRNVRTSIGDPACVCCTGHSIRLVTGDNALHIACREIKCTSCHEKMFKTSNRAREGLAELLNILHACGEDVNGQNSEGQTPLHVIVGVEHIMRFRYGAYSPYFDFPEAVRSLLLAGANPDLTAKSQVTSLHAAIRVYAHLFRFWSSGCDLKDFNSTIELLLKSGANPQAKEAQSFSPLLLLMSGVFPQGYGYPPTNSPDQFAHNRQLFHELVQTIRSYGGCAHATTNDGRSVFDMCKDDELLEKMRQDIPVTTVHLTLSRLAVAIIRKHQVQYRDKLPTMLIKIIEMRD